MSDDNTLNCDITHCVLSAS